MNVTACVIVIIVNNSLQQYGGDMAIGAYGIINRLLVLYVMIVLGLTMGMQPIVAITSVRKTRPCEGYPAPDHHCRSMYHQYRLPYLRIVPPCHICHLYQ